MYFSPSELAMVDPIRYLKAIVHFVHKNSYLSSHFTDISNLIPFIRVGGVSFEANMKKI